MLRTAALSLVALFGLGCGGALVPKLSSNDLQVKDYSPGAARCTVALSHSEPLVTEWPASSKVRLEALLNETIANTDNTAIAVSYSGCELRIVDECRPTAAYDWKKTSVSRDALEIQDADDLYAKLPLGAASLEGTLKRSGRLTVMTTAAGQIKMKRESLDLDAVSKNAACNTATHIIGSVTIGAFKMKAGGHGSASAGVNIGNAGGGASTSREEESLREAGVDAECGGATDEKPHQSCRSPLQLFLIPIPNRTISSTFTTTATLTTKVSSDPPPPKSSTMRTVSYILGGLGIAGLGGGTASYVVSNGTQSHIVNGPYNTTQEILDAQKSMATTRSIGVAGLISGGLMLGIAIPLFIVGGK